MSASWTLLVIILNITINHAHSNWYNCNSDESVCQSADCSSEHAAIKSNIICNSFPFYAGSLNLYNYQSQWSKVKQILSSCNEDNNSTNPYCNSWTQIDSKHATECKCINSFISINNYSNNQYCTSWECHYIAQNQISSKCDCLGKIEASYCGSWICNDTNFEQQTSYSIIEYDCISDKPKDNHPYYSEYIHFKNITNSNHSFCWNWIGHTLKLNEEQSSWSVINCECEIPKIELINNNNNNENDNNYQISNAYCDVFVCYQKSMDYYHNSRLQFYLSWIIGSIIGILLCSARYFSFKYGVIKNSSNIKILKIISNILLIISLLTILFWSFIYGSTLSAILVVIVWNITSVTLIPIIALRRYIIKKRNEELEKSRYEFKRQRDEYFARAPTRNSLFRYSVTDSDTEFYM